MTKADTTYKARIAIPPRALALLFIATVLFTASLPAFYQQTFGTRISDIPAHFSIGTSGQFPVYSILYPLIHGLLLIGTNQTALGWIAVILLSAGAALKGMLSFCMLPESKGLALPACAAVILGFAMPIMNWWNYQSVYLGQIAPTVWHNATTILVMPIVILLFRASLRCLEKPEQGNVASTAGLAILSALIKPSYVIAWLPAFTPWFLLKARIRSGASLQWLVKQGAILLVPLTTLLIVQGAMVMTCMKTSVIVSPFGVWSLYSPHPGFSILLSLAFPAAVSILHRDCLYHDAGLQLAWVVFAVSLLPLMLLAEEGARFAHGNFFWGAHMAIYLLFLSSVNVLLRNPTSIRSLSAFALLAVHFASGLYFYWRVVSGVGYM